MNAIDAIVYTSNTGFTAQYAALLGKRLGLPVLPLKEAGKCLNDGAVILYLGWLMAGRIKGYPQAARTYSVAAVCGVGMGAGGTQLEEARKANAIPANIPLFTLQGGFALNRLHGVYRFMMSTMQRTVGKKLATKPNRTADESDMLDLLQNGGSRVSEENLLPVLTWYEEANA